MSRKLILMAALGALTLSSCEKVDVGDSGSNQGPTPYTYTLHFTDPELRAFAPGTEFEYEIVNRDESGAPIPVTKDIECTLATPAGVNSYVNEFNSKWDSQTTILPASMYKADKAVMKAGESSVKIKVTIHRDKILKAAKKNAYVLPLEIVSSDESLLSHDLRYVMVPSVSVNGKGQQVVHLSNAADSLVIHQVAPNAAKCIVFYPGGGYEQLSSGKPTSTEYPADLYTVATLYYRLPIGNLRGKYWLPMQDAEDAVDYMRANAEENGGYALLGVAGRSAGGHLAGITTAYNKGKIDFEILLYPVINMNDGATHDGSAKFFLGPLPSPELVQAYSVHKQVTAETPRTFLAYSLDDYTVPMQYNGIYMGEALRENAVSHEEHIHETGGHSTSWSDYPAILQNWLKTF